MTQRTIYKWTINDFSKTASRDNPISVLNSNRFTLTGSNVKVRLQFRPTNVMESGSKEYCSVFLFLDDLGGEKSVKLDYKVWIENTDGDQISKPISRMVTHEFNDIEEGWGWNEFVHRDTLYSPASNFIKHDIVFICCKILYKSPTPNDGTLQFATEIAEKEWELYQEGFTGLCIIEVDDQKFEIEKKKLMAHSIVFDKMFRSGMQEAQTGKLFLNDTTPTVVKALAKYFHIHRIEDLGETTRGLYVLADKYEITDLKDKCSRVLIGKLDKDNIFDRLIMAFRHNDKVFKRGVLDYLIDHSGAFKEIMKSDGWKTFINDNMQLSREIIDEAFGSMNWY